MRWNNSTQSGLGGEGTRKREWPKDRDFGTGISARTRAHLTATPPPSSQPEPANHTTPTPCYPLETEQNLGTLTLLMSPWRQQPETGDPGRPSERRLCKYLDAQQSKIRCGQATSPSGDCPPWPPHRTQASWNLHVFLSVLSVFPTESAASAAGRATREAQSRSGSRSGSGSRSRRQGLSQVSQLGPKSPDPLRYTFTFTFILAAVTPLLHILHRSTLGEKKGVSTQRMVF